ncbi:MAG: hypothetical protein AAB486_00105 [Patescibacteria group bacterium]
MRALFIKSGAGAEEKRELVRRALRAVITDSAECYPDPEFIRLNLAQADFVVVLGTGHDTPALLDEVLFKTDIAVLILTDKPAVYRTVTKGRRVVVIDEMSGSARHPLEQRIRDDFTQLPTRASLTHIFVQRELEASEDFTVSPAAKSWLALGDRSGRKIIWHDTVYLIDHDLVIAYGDFGEYQMRVLVVAEIKLAQSQQNDPEAIEKVDEKWELKLLPPQ